MNRSNLGIPPVDTDGSCVDDSDDDPDFEMDDRDQECSTDDSSEWKAISSEDHPRSKPVWVGELSSD
ncbi:hypothetical protein QE152_g27796 [Popillia japonica]|uniref:Uncharacterized protein n=1 Tax=Popillia japonica TaxID=7064 RepID=A0AAW1JJS2_POPJA